MDEFYSLLGNEFCFVSTLPRRGAILKGGEDYSSRPYCILAGENDNDREYAFRLAKESETCVFGANSQEYAVERSRCFPEGLSFEMGERWLKHGFLTIGSPVFRKWLWNYYRYFHKANFYKLCCSSFTAIDDRKLNAYKNRHYKWGYFSGASGGFVEASRDVSTKGKVRILWCARFLLWKHPELVVELAAKLYNGGYDFIIEMYGGEGQSARYDKVYRREDLMALIEKKGMRDHVVLKGERPNIEIQKAMREADIFLFTSDQLEGWGAVANESMTNGCVLVASDAIGSTNFLVKNRETGMVFRSCDSDSLYQQVKFLLDNPYEMKRIAKAGQLLMTSVWSATNAAKNLLQLINDLSAGRETSIYEGPCSKA